MHMGREVKKAPENESRYFCAARLLSSSIMANYQGDDQPKAAPIGAAGRIHRPGVLRYLDEGGDESARFYLRSFCRSKNGATNV